MTLFDKKATIFFKDESSITGKITYVENKTFREFIFIETENNIHSFNKRIIHDIVWKKNDLTT